MSETHKDQIERVMMMADGSDCWDLSDNDTAALRAVLDDRSALLEALKRAEEVMNHFGDQLNGMDIVDAIEEVTGFPTSRIDEAFELVTSAIAKAEGAK